MVTEIGATSNGVTTGAGKEVRLGIVGAAAEALDLRAAPFVLEPALLRGLGGAGRNPSPRDAEGLPKVLHDALDGELAVPRLRPLVLRHGPNDGSRPADDPALLRIRERRRGLHVEDRLHAGLRFLRVLTARTARTGVAQLDLAERDRDRTVHPNRLAVHMAAILLDVGGVFHVSGEPIPGGAAALRRLRADGHRIRFVTNNTTRTQAQQAEELRGMGLELDDDELQTTPRAAARALAEKRVLALTMHAIVGELDGIKLVGEDAEAVLIGGADETPETNLVFSFMNLARAFHELEAGAALYCLHKNRWWQTKAGPLLDAGAFVAGLEYAADTEAVVLGKPSTAYFEAALAALDADAKMTWMVGDDIEEDIAGAQAHGMKTVLVRTGKFRPDAVERGNIRPDAIVSSIAQLPDWLEANV